jgi:alkaline phosphatase D
VAVPVCAGTRGFVASLDSALAVVVTSLDSRLGTTPFPPADGSFKPVRTQSSAMTTDADGYDELHSLLAARSLAAPVEPTEVDDASGSVDANGFDADPDRSPATTFPQSVASGDPTSAGAVLWTRIDPDAHAPGEPLGIEIAADERFKRVVYRGLVDAEHVTPDHDYAVNVETDGLLDADRHYHYRFTYGGVRSRVGRCHTLPAPDASPERLRFAVVTCQDYQNGYYGAYHHIAEEDVDYLLHVGDFIYESAAGQYKGRGSREYPDREIVLPSGRDRAWTLDDYRHLYATYRTDRCLQAALERHTLIAARDDHEFTDNLYWDAEAGAPRGPEHPRGDDPEFMRELVADALQAWWEHMPARVDRDRDAETFGERYRLWDRYRFGDLVDLVLTDERLYRDPPRNADNPLPTWLPVALGREAPERSMLGDEQREWFLDRVGASTATWTVWSDEVLTIPFKVGAGPATLHPSESGWDGYGGERRLIMDALAESDVSNFVTLTGDMHCYVAGYQQTAYRDALSGLLDGSAADADGQRVGVEFMTPPVTSINIGEAVSVDGGRAWDLTERLLSRAVRTQNPHMDFFDSHHWGYSIVEFTPEVCTYTGYDVDKTVDSPDAPKEAVVALRVPEGRVEIEELSPADARS